MVRQCHSSPTARRVPQITSGRWQQLVLQKPSLVSLCQTTSNQVAKLKNALLFTVVVDCALMNPCWGEGHRINRSLMQQHVDRLVTAYSEDEIRRFDPNTV